MITSHCLTRLSLTAACSVSRSRSAFTASVSGDGRLAARLQFERRQKLLGVGQVVAGDGGGGAGGGAHVGHLLAQGIDLDRQEAGLLGPRGDAVELARPQVDQLGERPLRRRRGLGERRAGANRAAARQATPGGGIGACSFLSS